MADESTRTVTMIVLILAFLGMMIFVAMKAKKNRMDALKNQQPKVAGEDVLEGGARHPQRFDEPDDEALEERADLLGEGSEDDS